MELTTRLSPQWIQAKSIEVTAMATTDCWGVRGNLARRASIRLTQGESATMYPVTSMRDICIAKLSKTQNPSPQ